MAFGSKFFYSSLYSTIFPPLFLKPDTKIRDYYISYLSNLQKEFINRIEFCLDEDFYPNILGKFTPAGRYMIYCDINKTTPLNTRTESFNILFNGESEHTLELTNEVMEFSKKYNIDPAWLASSISNPKLNIYYSCSTIHYMLNLEFTKIIEHHINFKKCKNCGKYFITKGNYNSNYCDRIIENTNKTCQQIATIEKYKDKVKSNPAWKLYNTYYKRYFARAKVGTIKQPAFKKWQYQATSKRDDCLDGMLSLDEYETWLKSSFLNR